MPDTLSDMSKPLKTYATQTKVWVPTALWDALGAPSPHPQAQAFAVAATKAEITGALGMAQMTLPVIKPIVAALRLRSGVQSLTWQTVIDAGLVDLNRPGVYFARGAADGDLVVRVHDDARTGSTRYEAVARFIVDQGRRTVEGALPC